VRIDVIGAPAVIGEGGVVTGSTLGGRRAQIALVALALERTPVSSERLAGMIWSDGPPRTWPAALRGVVRGLRAALALAGGSGQQLIATIPGGYRLAAGIAVDVEVAERSVREAVDLAAAGRLRAALGLARPLTRLRGDDVLTGEDGDWLRPHRAAVDAVARRALEVIVDAAGRLGDHAPATTAARSLVAGAPLDEAAHRRLIQALAAAGDRSGAVRAFEDCRATLADELGIDPSPATVQAYLGALVDQAPSARARVPRRTSSFVGRRAESALLERALDTPGLITLTGVGGVGKSRLAAQVAATAGEFPGGRLWVSLEPVSQDALVAATVALALGTAPGAVDAATAVAEHVAPLGRTLLVLDGCERSTDGVESLVVDLLARCPMITVLLTSRVRLGLRDETVVDLEPFAVSPVDEPGTDRDDPLTRLLLDRVREGGGELQVDERVEPALSELLRRCAGLPLAVELVAAQLASMPVGDLLDQIDTFVPDARNPLRAIVRGSYEALDDNEAAVFRRLAVLEGSFGLAFARQVVSDAVIAPVRVVRILRELAANGLVGVDRSEPRWRYQQDDDLHRFARELLADHGEEEAAFAKLADAIRALLPEDAREPPTPFADSVTEVLESVRSLFNAGLGGTADGNRCLELAFRLHRYWASTHVVEGRFWLSELLARHPGAGWAPHATYALGYLDYWSGDTERAVVELQSAVERLKDSYAARALIYLAGLMDDQDRGEEAVGYVRRAMDAARPFGTDLQVAAAMGLGSVLSERGDPEAARHAIAAIELCRDRGSREQLAAALPTAAMVCWQVGAIREASELVDEARPLHTGGMRIARVVLLSVSAGLALAAGDVPGAVDIGSLADREGTELGVEREMPLIRSVLARALLAAGDHVAAADRAAGALLAALSMGFSFPLAIGLETAALVLRTSGLTGDADLGLLLDAASEIRRRGDRPAPATLRADVDRLRTLVPSTGGHDPRAAAELALRLLAGPDAGGSLDLHEKDRTPPR
jgi:predicted ATPase/DNA-binding SARP family transcriptional activator